MGKVYIDFRRLHPEIRASSNKGTFYGAIQLHAVSWQATWSNSKRKGWIRLEGPKMFILKIRSHAPDIDLCRLFVSFRCGALKIGGVWNMNEEQPAPNVIHFRACRVTAKWKGFSEISLKWLTWNTLNDAWDCMFQPGPTSGRNYSYLSRLCRVPSGVKISRLRTIVNYAIATLFRNNISQFTLISKRT